MCLESYFYASMEVANRFRASAHMEVVAASVEVVHGARWMLLRSNFHESTAFMEVHGSTSSSSFHGRKYNDTSTWNTSMEVSMTSMEVLGCFHGPSMEA